MNYINIIDSLIVHKSGTKITITNSKGNHSWSMINYNSSLTWNNLGLPLTNHDSSAVTIICPDEWAFKWEDHRIFQQAKWLRYQVLKNIRACQNLSLTKKHDRFVHVFRVWLGYIYIYIERESGKNRATKNGDVYDQNKKKFVFAN